MSTANTLPPITPRTLAVVQDLMKRDGLNGDDAQQVSLYVERLIARERFFRTLGEIRERTATVPDDVLEQVIDEAVQASRSR